jgi:hypothetical protein
MRFQFIVKALIFGLLSLSSFASSDKEMQKLFDKYEDVTKYHNVEIVEEVFTKNFLKNNGGKEEFIEKVLSVPKEKKKKGLGLLVKKWKKSKVGKFFSAKVKGPEANSPSAEFIIKEEDGKLKIDGTISDG